MVVKAEHCHILSALLQNGVNFTGIRLLTSVAAGALPFLRLPLPDFLATDCFTSRNFALATNVFPAVPSLGDGTWNLLMCL